MAILVVSTLFGSFMGYRLDWFLFTYHTYTITFAVVGFIMGLIIAWMVSHRHF